VTESGWELDEAHIKVDFFNDHDLALLGDIHKTQYLGYRETASGEKKPWIAYSGCPIQQNYAEELDHGYLLWDIKGKNDWDIKFKKLPNPKPYVTIQWSGSTKDLISTASNYPDGSRFRIRSSEALGQKEFRLISETLKSSKVATEVTFKSDFIVDKSVIKTDSSTIEKADLRNSDILVKLIKNYYSNTQISKDEWNTITEQVKNCLDESNQ
jgi:hypothetical protein